MFDTLPLLISLIVATEAKLPDKLEGRVLDVFPGDRLLLSFGTAQGARKGMAVLLRNEPEKRLINLYELVEAGSGHSIARRLDAITPPNRAKLGDSAFWYAPLTALPRASSPPAEIPKARAWLYEGAVIRQTSWSPVRGEYAAVSLATQMEESFSGSRLGLAFKARLSSTLPKGWSIRDVFVTLETLSFTAALADGQESYEWRVFYSRKDKATSMTAVSTTQRRVRDGSDLAFSATFRADGGHWSRPGPVAWEREPFFEGKTSELRQHFLKALGP